MGKKMHGENSPYLKSQEISNNKYDMAEQILITSISIAELRQMIKEAVDTSLDVRFEPLRKQFEDRLMTANETAEKLGVTRMTLHNLEKRGELMPVRIGCKVQYRESDITIYLRNK